VLGAVALVLAGLVLLPVGAALLVRGAAALAAAAGLSRLVVGLTVVAIGTSAPEIAVSVGAAVTGHGDLALGNVVGSNVFNVLLILGVSALLTPLVVARQLVWLDIPIMIGASIVVLLLALDGALGRLDGLLLLAAGVGYTVFVVRESRAEAARGEPVAPAAAAAPRGPAWLHGGLVLGGLALLLLGARWLVDGASTLARAAGVTELVIGLTIVAAGTSLPEAATSVVAALRGERDIAVGNVVGSCIYNLLLILGLAALLAPGLPVAPAIVAFDLPVAIAVAVACLPICFTDHLVARWEGALFVAYYAAYTLYLVLNATGHGALAPFGHAMLGYVLPLTVVTLVLLYVRAARRVRRPR
jgi:cation:H+ antiporter